MRKRLVALDSEPYRRFAAQLVATRERAGITQRDLAKRTGWSQSQVAKHELGAQRMDVVELGVFCEACGESLEAFVRRLCAAPVPPRVRGRAPGCLLRLAASSTGDISRRPGSRKERERSDLGPWPGSDLPPGACHASVASPSATRHPDENISSHRSVTQSTRTARKGANAARGFGSAWR